MATIFFVFRVLAGWCFFSGLVFFSSGVLFRGRRAVYYGLCTLYVTVLL